ncbi:MAG: ndh [Crocinitomicaceae bacterium]|jgi:NADH dehydrogenase|nr:ndh [Crocinitomicaceae bacterium]
MNERKQIIVIGGGFAGMQFVRKIDTSLFDVLLIDKLNHHQFQPLFYQVATSQLEPSSISFPFRKIFQKKRHLQIRMTEVLKVEPEKNLLHTGIGVFDYDYLVIATGCQTNFFNNKSIAESAFTLKSTYDSITIRNHVLQMFEDYISSSDEEREAMLNIVIAGAGPTGVEMAGAFAEIKKNILPKDYPGIDFSHLKIIVVEGSANTLNSMSDNAKAASRQYLEEMGVEVVTQVQVLDYINEVVHLSNGREIKCKTLVWAAGVTGNLIEGMNPDVVQRGNRLKVNRTNRVEGYDDIYAIGDIAHMETPKYPKGHPQLANVAINQAVNLARNFKRKLNNKELKEFEYRDLGSMATVGKHKAVVDLPFMKFKGFFAWYVWMFLHLMLILSVKNKLIIFINWAWAYITKDTSLRLILVQPEEKEKKKTVVD